MNQEEISYTILRAAVALGVSRSELQDYTNEGLIEAELRSVGTGVRRGIRYTAQSIRDFALENPDLIGTQTPAEPWVLEDDSIIVEEESIQNVVTSGLFDSEDNGDSEDSSSEFDDDPDSRIDLDVEGPEEKPGQIFQSVTPDESLPVSNIGSELSVDKIGEARTPYTRDSEIEMGMADSQSTSHFVFGLGATGVQIVDQARKSEFNARRIGTDSLETPYRFFVMDTSSDVDPERPGSHTREGFIEGWFNRNDILILSNLTGGAGRIPVVSEFIANYSLDPKLTETGETNARLSGIDTSYLVHSIGGGTGCGLAPKLARWLRDNAQGGTRISITLLGNAQGAVANPAEADNSLFAFPKVNEEMDLVVLIDNTTVARRYEFDERTKTETIRYLHELDNVLLAGIPQYLEANSLYAASDRYAYRIMSSINRLPEDITNVITHFRTNVRFAAGAKWVLPYLYPLNADYEYDCREIPPGLMVLRALENGALCNPANLRPDSSAVVICEYPDDYPNEFVMNIQRDAQKVVSDVLHLKEQNVRVIPFRSPGRGFAATVLVAGNEPEIFPQWISDIENIDRRKEIRDRWSRRVSSPDSEQSTAGDAWDTICRLTAEAVKDTAVEQESFFQVLRQAAVEWRTTGAKYDISDEFLKFIEKTGFTVDRDREDINF